MLPRATPGCRPTSVSLPSAAPSPLAAMLPALSTAGFGRGQPQANPDTYNSVIAGQTLTVSDPAKGVIANDINVYGVQAPDGAMAAR